MNASPLPPGSLLLCLDLQPSFLRALPDADRVLGRCRFAVSCALGLGMPVAFTEQAPAKLGATDPTLLALAGRAPVHAKETFSALAQGSAVRRALTEATEIDHLLVCGIETPICVYQTALDALRAGVAVTVLSDCVGERRQADGAACLDALARGGAHILPSETVFYSLLGSSAHPFFRAYTELVKTHA